MTSNPCPLCVTVGCVPVPSGRARTFVHCPQCDLVFVPGEEWLSPEAERARYDKHDNTAANAGYVRFLSEVVDVVRALPEVPRQVLDFGCGEHAVLCGLLEQAGVKAIGYDPAYPNRRGLEGMFDVVVLCEVVEHLRDLRGECARLVRHLQPASRIVVRTRPHPGPQKMATWWYGRDPTHIHFFSPQTIQYLAGLLGKSRLNQSGQDLFVLS